MKFRIKLFTLLVLVTLGLVLAACSALNRTTPPPEWLAWRAQRHESVAGTNGWATLVGLLWLPEGTNTLGSDPASGLRLPVGRAAAAAGVVIRSGYQARFIAAPGRTGLLDGKAVTDAALRSDADNGEPSVLTLGPLRLIVLQRGERLALRVKDPAAPTQTHFVGLDYFPFDPHWRIEGRLEPATAPRTLRITDVIGGVKDEPSPGTLVFTVQGQVQRLDALDDAETHDLWVVFRDTTAGKATYGGGRFLHVAKPGPDHRVVLDFNAAYNPPCAFTPFATCPLPPRQNWLRIAVPAGEKKYRGGHE